MKKKREIINGMMKKRQFRQIRILIKTTLKNSDYAYTAAELHQELEKQGYNRNLHTIRVELNRIMHDNHDLFAAKSGTKKYYFMI
jgi:hypothetical protein